MPYIVWFVQDLMPFWHSNWTFWYSHTIRYMPRNSLKMVVVIIEAPTVWLFGTGQEGATDGSRMGALMAPTAGERHETESVYRNVVSSLG